MIKLINRVSLIKKITYFSLESLTTLTSSSVHDGKHSAHTTPFLFVPRDQWGMTTDRSS